MRRFLTSLAIAALASPAALASWAAVPLEVVVDQADLIVAGKVTKIQDGGFAIGIRKHDVAVLEVSRVLKGPAGTPKVVHIAQPGMGIVSSADIRFSPGQRGIWLLTRDPERNVCWARHPSQVQDDKEEKKLTALVDAREKVAGGPAVKGLVARAELVERPGTFEVRFSLKNVTDKPITVCDYVGNQPLQVQWLGPDGKMHKSNHYAWLAFADISALMKGNFPSIPPGGVRFIGSQGMATGIVFLAPTEKPARSFNQAQVGKHRVTVSFATKQDGKEFGVENVWTGTVTANEVSFTVK